jgi:predicted dehydrogenase
MKFLVAGLGGIGQRHVRNLRQLYGHDCEILAYRTRGTSAVLTDRLEIGAPSGLEERYAIKAFTDLDQALAEQPDAALICNPTSSHVAVALAAARAGCHLMIEKPVAASSQHLDELQGLLRARKLICMVAYQMRFHPCIELLGKVIKDGDIGTPIAARATVGEYLPGWHPYEDYRQMYASRADLGGGVVLTQIHELDILYWLFGRPARVMSMGGHWSDLEIDVEDVASTLLDYGSMVAHLHQDYVQRPPMRQIEVIGKRGKVLVDLRAASIEVFDEGGACVMRQSFENLERNTLFLKEMEQFVGAINGTTQVSVDLEDGRQSLEIGLAIRQSLNTKQIVELKARP